ncbi:hypothetical protein, partial [Kluyvera intermedia]|uniref:hypothetical protein n=1 Tax=Kluyvera intermedia TaxID=61648 RepID=UPI003B9F64EB
GRATFDIVARPSAAPPGMGSVQPWGRSKRTIPSRAAGSQSSPAKRSAAGNGLRATLGSV